MEVLTAYLRGHTRSAAPPAGGELSTARGEAAAGEPPTLADIRAIEATWDRLEVIAAAIGARRTPADMQAIATMIARRRRSQDPTDQRLDLQQVALPRPLWRRAQLEGAILEGVQLQWANLIRAQLKGAND